MECEKFLESYSDFLDGLLGEEPLSDCRNHLLRCPDCGEYDRVMRRGLRLVRELDRPEATPDFGPRLQKSFLAGSRRGEGAGDYTKAVLVAGLATLSLIVIASLPALRLGGRAVQLPPLVVETPAGASQLPSLWGPPPRFAPSASLLRVPDLSGDQLLAPPPQRFSLFRVTTTSPTPPAETEEVAPE